MTGPVDRVQPPGDEQDGHADEALVCEAAIDKALTDLWIADIGCRRAKERLTGIRESLDSVMADASRNCSFTPLEKLFQDEEAAMAAFSVWKLRRKSAERRCLNLRMALVQEKDMLTSGRTQLH